MMRWWKAAPILVGVALLAACGSKRSGPAAIQTEQQNSAEREALLNAVEQHPSLTDPSQASAPINIPTTIPPPAPDSGMAGHEHGGMDMGNMPAPDPSAPDANQSQPQ